MFKKIRWTIEFVLLYIPYLLIRILPWCLMRATAWLIGFLLYLLPSVRKLVRANIKAAMPELSDREVKRIARACFDNVSWNMTEYIWMVGNEKRIRRCCGLSENVQKELKKLRETETRIIFVTPHFGSWEAAGLMAPFYGGVKIAAIAKPMRNPYLNKFLNSHNRENTPGVQIIFSKGAMRAAIQALKDGYGIGTLIDQNTRVRDGGVFVNFFGLPVPSSTAPAMLQSYCNQKKIPCQIFFACSLREKSGKVVGRAQALDKSFEEYASHREILQELMEKSEKLIRENPEQYLWMYRRFQYIPEDATPEQISRYPRYAVRPGKAFYSKVERQKKHAENNEPSGA